MNIFDQDGPLAQAIRGYRPRPGQIEMARAILDRRGRQVLEAGTGIGKTFAYLAPIIQHGMSAVISTGTRALQDQLFLRDIPFLTTALQRPVQMALLKGRSNYICLRNLAEPEQSQLFDGDSAEWQRILEFSRSTEDGDIRSANIPPNSRVAAAAVSTTDNCTRQRCKFYNKCFLYKARAHAKQADIVVVNHHLFLADMRLREESVAELLPERDIIVFDEAHLLPPMAPEYFGEKTSAAEIFRLSSDIEREITQQSLPEHMPALVKKLRDAGGLLLECSAHIDNSIAGAEIIKNAPWHKATKRLQEDTRRLRDAAIEAAQEMDSESAERFVPLIKRVSATTEKLQRWLALANGKTLSDIAPISAAAESIAADGEISDEDADMPFVCWVQRQSLRDNITLHAAPVSGRSIFRRAWENYENIIMTSATLTVSDSFLDFVEDAGMDGAHEQSWESPFDYQNRSMLYLPPDMPDPNSRDYSRAVATTAAPLICANGGRAFMLFSSLRAMHEGAEMLSELLDDDYCILLQGDASNDILLQRFSKEPKAILAGSLSFWQGVDVRGGALSLVIADKIPFTPPDSPLLTARDEWRKRRGENPFMRNQLPKATILMKQVAGRLMRDFDDWGVFAACDPRLISRGYGKSILNSLPPMHRTKDQKTACDFLRKMQEENGGG